MSRNIKSLKKLHSLIGGTVQVVDSEGYKFNAVVKDGKKHGVTGQYAVTLVTADSKADNDPFWWPLSISEKTWGHHVVRQDQLTKELRSVTTVKEKAGSTKKDEQKGLTLKDLKKNIGHCCTFDSGDKGYICETARGSILICFNTRQHGCGWEVDEDVPEYLHKHFKYAWFIGSDSLIKDLGIVSIDSEPTELQATFSKESFLTREQLLEHIGKRCKMSDGTEGLIVKTTSGTPRVLMKARANGHGWLYNESCEADTGASEKVRGQYKYAWNIKDDEDAEDISVVEILEDDSEKCAESSKTILDMTIREVLEKLDEIIKR